MKREFEVVSDSSCDLPKELVEEKEVKVVPFYVTFDGERFYKEGVEIDMPEFYERMVENPKVIPKSSMPTLQDYVDVFTPLAKAGTPVICICISSKFSGSVDCARSAKGMVLEEYPEAVIEVIDAQINTVLQGNYVLEACKLRDAGKGVQESVQILEEIRSTGRIFFTVGNLDYLKANGRIGKLSSLAGSVLGLRPLITLKDGEVYPSGVGRSRKSTLAKSLELTLNYIQEVKATPEEYVMNLGYGYDYEEAVNYRTQIIAALAENGFRITEQDLPLFRVGCAISVHTGPYAMGITILKRAIPVR
ncbi:MAG: DegV family protein [Lachnospiraceae bacterium]|nr:DegV family protein [Lachnospiraceae bacterium]